MSDATLMAERWKWPFEPSILDMEWDDFCLFSEAINQIQKNEEKAYKDAARKRR